MTDADKEFSAEERDAMKERARELKANAKRDATEADQENEVLAKIAEMPDSDRVIAERLHAQIKASVPTLSAKLWYGQPAYAKDGKVICFFQGASKFNTRYSTFGFSDAAKLDDGAMWSTSFALTKLTSEDESKIVALVKRAAS